MTLFYFVDLYELDRNAKQRKVATFKLEDGNSSTVEVDGDERHPLVENLKREGIFDYKF